ncbi:MAG: hypothetical protein QXR17_08240 [Candidatus Bathyarchaeia archaeon]
MKLLLEHGDLTEEEAKTAMLNYYENENKKIIAKHFLKNLETALQ